MKQLFILISILFICLSSVAHVDINGAEKIKAIVLYTANQKGFYERKSNIELDTLVQALKAYAYDKKNRNLYVLTRYGNVVMTLSKDKAKSVKKDTSIPQFTGNALNDIVDRHNKELDNKFTQLNSRRETEISDSINQKRADSIAAQKTVEALNELVKRQRESYLHEHNYHDVPTGNIPLHCLICGNDIKSDSVSTLGIANDTIYFTTQCKGNLNLQYTEAHIAKIPEELKNYGKFRYHYSLFKDSLTRNDINYKSSIASLGLKWYDDYEIRIRRLAPYGFFNEWHWDSEYGNVSFAFRYTNTNVQTLKYITVYFKITNSVGDVRKTGYFQGTGPLKKYETGSWNWDSSPYFVSGDASEMVITKAVVTYMNGRRQVVSGRYLQFDTSD